MPATPPLPQRTWPPRACDLTALPTATVLRCATAPTCCHRIAYCHRAALRHRYVSAPRHAPPPRCVPPPPRLTVRIATFAPSAPDPHTCALFAPPLGASAQLSWLEKKAAAALFASPPTATFDDALGHFEAAERMDPGFYPKNRLLLAMACAKVGRVEEARTWRERCLAAPARTPEDEQTLKEAAAFKP